VTVLLVQRSKLAGVLVGLAAFCITMPASGQTNDPAPYLHTPARHQIVHKSSKKKIVPKLVPVVAPHHAAPRLLPNRRQVSRLPGHSAPTKPAAKFVPAEISNAVPKKPPPPAALANIGAKSGLPLPRYAALKSDDVNMRAGPGERYPVLWKYQRRDLPVKIEQEFDIWRQVEDMDGIKGWMQQGFLAGHRSFVIIGTEDRTLRSDASDTADPVAILKSGVVGRLRACDAGREWCQVQVQDYRGWLKRTDFWGADPSEAITP